MCVVGSIRRMVCRRVAQVAQCFVEVFVRGFRKLRLGGQFNFFNNLAGIVLADNSGRLW
jgi:hypothetical protein